MKILYLYSELSPYLRPVFETYIKTYGVELHVVHWDHLRLTPYQPVPMENLYYYKRTETDLARLRELTEELVPDLIYVAGWMDMDYLRIARRWRARRIPVVVVFDGIWIGTLRQKLGSTLVRFLGRLFFSHAFVSFARQYEYAKKFGFKDDDIIFNALSCDTKLFHKSLLNLPNKVANYPRVFIYAGRFAEEKGVRALVDAFKRYRDELGGTWKLICVGSGPLRCLLENEEGIEMREFVSQQDLVSLFNSSGALILPGYLDPSPLALHEATSACLPVILSTNIGNRSTFLIDGFNGFTFRVNSSISLASAMLKLSTMSDDELICMSKNSYTLSTRVSPELSAASLMSILLNN